MSDESCRNKKEENVAELQADRAAVLKLLSNSYSLQNNFFLLLSCVVLLCFAGLAVSEFKIMPLEALPLDSDPLSLFHSTHSIFVRFLCFVFDHVTYLKIFKFFPR